MLQRHVREDLRQMLGTDEFVPVLGVRTDDIHRKFGRKFAVRVESNLIFRKVFGLAEFPHVVIVRHGAGERGIFVERNGARFREVRDDDTVIERTHGAVFHLAHERRVVIGQFSEPIIGDAVETHLVHGQKRHKEHRGEYARLYPEQKEIDHIAPLSVFEAYRHDEYGNADDETEQKGA